MDPRLLLDFLSRPRTITELAERFGMTVGEVEATLKEAMESGRVLVEKDPRGAGSRLPIRSTLGNIRESSPVSRRSAGRKRESLPRLRTSRVHSTSKLHEVTPTAFKLREAKPKLVRNSTIRPSTSELFGKRWKRDHKSGHTSIGLELALLETVQPRPKQLLELRSRLGLSRITLESFVKKGLLEAEWSPDGVGAFFKITSKGKEELKRLTTASSLAASVDKRKLVPLKKLVPQYSV